MVTSVYFGKCSDGVVRENKEKRGTTAKSLWHQDEVAGDGGVEHRTS